VSDLNTSDRDANRAIRSWLHEDRHADASRIAAAVLDQVETTRQRRATWWPARRTPPMNKIIGFAGAAAVVVAAVALVGINGTPGDRSGSAPTAQPSSSPSPTVAPTATPQPSVAALPLSGEIDAGTYLATVGTSSFRVTLPAGWDVIAENGSRDIRKHRDQPGEVGFIVFSPDINVYPDACATEESPPRTGPTADDLVAALSAQKNSDVSEPAPITIGGRPAIRVDVSTPKGLDIAGCFEGIQRIWSGATGGNYLAVGAPSGTYPVSIVETLSGRIVFTTIHDDTPTAADKAEQQAIVDSIQIDASAP
jgi:hypothetical protein